MDKKYSYNLKSTGIRIKNRRKHLGLSQEEVAQKTGYSTKYYSDIERGSGMSIKAAIAIANELDMSLDYMICGISSEERDYENESADDAYISMLRDMPGEVRRNAATVLSAYARAIKNTL